MNRGFFSAFLAGFAIILMIAVLYTSSARSTTQSHVDETLIAQQELSKDWFLARNVFVNFASDAIASKITSCSPPSDYGDVVANYWSVARTHMLTAYGVDCIASLDGDLKESFGFLNDTMVTDNDPAFALLHCSRTIGETTLELTHPFVIRKNVEIIPGVPSCTVNVYDTHANSTPELDVTKFI